ncbi:MAG: hypothetical protein V4469_00015 [Patescibacteria group bacterium]
MSKKIPLEKIASVLDVYEFVLVTKNVEPKDCKNRLKAFLSSKRSKKQKLEYAFYLIKRGKGILSKGKRPINVFKKAQRYLVSSGLYDKSEIDYHNDPNSSF